MCTASKLLDLYDNWVQHWHHDFFNFFFALPVRVFHQTHAHKGKSFTLILWCEDVKSNTHLDHLDPIAPAGKVLKCCKILKYTHLMPESNRILLLEATQRQRSRSTYAQRSANASRFILLRFLSLRQKPTLRLDICLRMCVWMRADWATPVIPPTDMAVRTAASVKPVSTHFLAGFIQ